MEEGGVVRAIRVPDGKRISNSRIKPKGDISNEAVAGGAAGLAYIRVMEDGIDAAKPIKVIDTWDPIEALWLIVYLPASLNHPLYFPNPYYHPGGTQRSASIRSPVSLRWMSAWRPAPLGRWLQAHCPEGA